MGHIPDRGISRVKRRRPISPAKSLFHFLPLLFLFCWAWTPAGIMNTTQPSLLTTKWFALRSKCGGAFGMGWNLLTIEEAKVKRDCLEAYQAAYVHVSCVLSIPGDGEVWVRSVPPPPVCSEENDRLSSETRENFLKWTHVSSRSLNALPPRTNIWNPPSHGC